MFDLFDDFNFFPIKYRFSRGLKDMIPTYVTEKDGKVVVVANVLGISDSDLNISVENSNVSGWKYMLWVRGKTYNEILDQEFEVNLPFTFNKEISQIERHLENGILTLHVSFEEPVKPSVKIVKI